LIASSVDNSKWQWKDLRMIVGETSNKAKEFFNIYAELLEILSEESGNRVFLNHFEQLLSLE